tara:strand:+ start:278 stop:460 length:183 start_codon:yes stop_codon:yes gene_type:complete
MMRNLIEKAFDKLVTTKSVTRRYIGYSKKYPGIVITYKGQTIKNGEIIKTNKDACNNQKK